MFPFGVCDCACAKCSKFAGVVGTVGVKVVVGLVLVGEAYLLPTVTFLTTALFGAIGLVSAWLLVNKSDHNRKSDLECFIFALLSLFLSPSKEMGCECSREELMSWWFRFSCEHKISMDGELSTH